MFLEWSAQCPRCQAWNRGAVLFGFITAALGKRCWHCHTTITPAELRAFEDRRRAFEAEHGYGVAYEEGTPPTRPRRA